MSQRTLVIYHADCNDGFCAAWAARHAFPDAQFAACAHGDPAPEVDGADVFVLDFAFDRDTTLDLHARAASFRVIDHHQSALERLGDLPFCDFDLSRSGAGLAWDELCEGPRPWLVDYVEDRDMWWFRQPESRAVNAYLMAAPHDFEAWDTLAARSPQALVAEGQAILRYQARMLERLLPLAHRATIAGHEVPVVNSHVLVSELGGALAKGEPFAAVYHDAGDGTRRYSLRSTPEGLDCARVAERFGGGGHPRAAGFRLPSAPPADAVADPPAGGAEAGSDPVAG